MDTKALLSRLGIEPVNSGGKGISWIAASGPEITSVNPATGEALARVKTVTAPLCPWCTELLHNTSLKARLRCEKSRPGTRDSSWLRETS